jgi:DNA polymerase III epsilon subunit-like protein
MTTPVPTQLLGQELVVVDVEGNGHNPPEIVEIAALRVTDTVDYADIRTWLIRPQVPIAAVVTRTVHGISNLDVADCPTWSDVATEVSDTLGDRVLIAHGAHVENRVLRTHLPTWQPPMVLDTLRLAKQVWPGLPSYSLGNLVDHANLDMTAVADQRQHRAGYDTWCAWQLLRALLDEATVDWAGLVKVAALPGSIAPAEPEAGLW